MSHAPVGHAPGGTSRWSVERILLTLGALMWVVSMGLTWVSSTRYSLSPMYCYPVYYADGTGMVNCVPGVMLPYQVSDDGRATPARVLLPLAGVLLRHAWKWRSTGWAVLAAVAVALAVFRYGLPVAWGSAVATAGAIVMGVAFAMHRRAGGVLAQVVPPASLPSTSTSN